MSQSNIGFTCGIDWASPAIAAPVTAEAQAVVAFSDAADPLLGETVDLSYTFETDTVDFTHDPNAGIHTGGVVGRARRRTTRRQR